MRVILLISVFIISLCFFARAEDKAESGQRFAGIVQFSSGDYTQVTPNGEKRLLKYKDIIGTGDKISGTGDGYIKIVTENYCVGVLYKGELVAPHEALGVWSSTGSVRWVCPDNRSQSVALDGHELLITGGELLYRDGKLLILKKKVQDNLLVLRMNHFFRWRPNNKLTESKWRSVDKPSDREKYFFSHEVPIPLESVSISEKAPPDKVIKFRIGLSGFPVGIGNLSHSEKSYSYFNGPYKGGKIYGSFGVGSGGILISYTNVSLKNSWNDNSGSTPTSLGPPQSSFNTDSQFLQAGYRFDYQSSFGIYGTVGAGTQKNKINTMMKGNPLVSVNTNVTYTAAIVSLGVEKIFFSGSWIALQVGAEAQYTHTLSVQSMESTNTNNAALLPTFNENQPFDTFGAVFTIGPVLQFE